MVVCIYDRGGCTREAEAGGSLGQGVEKKRRRRRRREEGRREGRRQERYPELAPADNICPLLQEAGCTQL